ncbi:MULTISPECIES: CRISPR-associated endoribonuclease Cas6 [Clostridium]|uniref:CRISPR-associated endoribonuclease Cas6 n=1 Tax=Clostridium TaxID=1485 RepID=UPI000825BB63|nr:MULTISPECIES: CRISPR-associated endoribonuclease Cas6 [Clostridium]PJI06537.1 CRISPR-associated endoribonuclease Cas6 [Clostridium sp. CT7]
MRIKVRMTVDKDIIFPIAYSHLIQKLIYNILEDNYSSRLHDGGYKYKNKKFKLFNYSKMMIENKTIEKGKIIIHKGRVELTISSIDEIFIMKIIDALLSIKRLEFNEGTFNIDSIYSKKQLNSGKIKVLTISPVVVTKPGNFEKTEFYTPDDREFIESLKNNIISKYNAFYKKAYSGRFNISISDRSKVRKKIDKYKNWIYEGYLSGFVIEGENDIVNLAYSTGLGSKNSQGFGCVELFRDVNNLRDYRRIY